MLPEKSSSSSSKARTGIEGFDEITGGGLPRGRTTLIEGGPGSGKTIMTLQALVNGARLDDEPAIFIAFEESSDSIVSNASKFGWDLEALQEKKLFFLDARPQFDILQSGSFDLGGMLAVLDAKVREMGATRIAFDALDVILALLPDALARRREVCRLHEWLLARKLTAIITFKSSERGDDVAEIPSLGFMQFLVDCAVVLNHEVQQGVSQRNLRVIKYRGSSFSENESPFLIGSEGIEVAGAPELGRSGAPVPTERVSSGVPRLDSMLGGGYHRGASVLITGFPGTAKSTLGGAFAEAACGRGERTLLISFDSDANEVVRNLGSVGINLGDHIRSGLLQLVSARAVTGSGEIHLMQIKRLARAHRARCVVVDPVSSMSKFGNEETASRVAERLVDWTKQEGISLVCTSLLESPGSVQIEGTPLKVSTVADTWIHLNYLVHAGERNRGLSIIKSRGTAHSNQVRELILSDEGVTLADAYTADGEVLMGTMRWEKEKSASLAEQKGETLSRERDAALEREELELALKLETLRRDLDSKRLERAALARSTEKRTTELGHDQDHRAELRGADES